jgi:hypothetical protein
MNRIIWEEDQRLDFELQLLAHPIEVHFIQLVLCVRNNEWEYLPQVLELVLEILKYKAPQQMLPLEISPGNVSDHF